MIDRVLKWMLIFIVLGIVVHLIGLGINGQVWKVL